MHTRRSPRRVVFRLDRVRLNLAAGVTVAALAAPVLGATPNPSKPEPETPRSPAPQGREVDLRPKFRVGRDTRYRFDLSSANRLKSTTTPELDGDQTLTQSIGLRMHPVELTEDGAVVELIYDSIKATLETADFRAAFDSARPAGARTPQPKPSRPGRSPASPSGASPNPNRSAAPDAGMDDLLAQIMRPMVGTKLTMHVDKNGNITSVSGGDALAGGGIDLQGLLQGLGGAGGLGGGMGVPTGGRGAGGGPMAWVITGPAQRSTVHVGESWTNNDSLSGTPIGGFSMVTKHTCRSASGGLANFVFSGRADARSLGDPSGPLGGFSLKESSYGGTYVWDTARGELKEVSATLNTKIEQTAGNGSTQMSAETRITIRRAD